MKCFNCRRERDEESMEQFVLTDEERTVIRLARGVDDADFWVCRPCVKLFQDPIQGAQLIKGTLQVHLSARGNPNAEKIAQRFYEGLLKIVARNRKPSS